MRLLGIVFGTLFFGGGLGLFFFTCAHYGVWWPLFSLLSGVLGFFLPALCFNYNQDGQDVFFHQLDSRYGEEGFQNCRDLGWTLAALLHLFSMAVWVIVWYNEMSRFPWPGVLMGMGSTTLLWWTYAIWLRMAVFTQ